MPHIYRASIFNHFKAATGSLIVVGILTPLVIALAKYSDWTLLIVLILVLLPCLYLHLEYTLLNQNAEFCIDSENEVFWYKTNSGKITKIPFSAVERIEFYMSADLIKGSYSRHPMHAYHYTKIVGINKDVIYVTCLLVPEGKKAFMQLPRLKQATIKSFFTTVN